VRGPIGESGPDQEIFAGVSVSSTGVDSAIIVFINATRTEFVGCGLGMNAVKKQGSDRGRRVEGLRLKSWEAAILSL